MANVVEAPLPEANHAQTDGVVAGQHGVQTWRSATAGVEAFRGWSGFHGLLTRWVGPRGAGA